MIFACLHLLLNGRGRSTCAQPTLPAPPAMRLCRPGCKRWPLPSALGLGCRDPPLTTVLQPALLRPPWGPGTRSWRRAGRWWGAASGSSQRPQCQTGWQVSHGSHPQGLRTRNSTFEKHVTEKCLALKLLGLSSAESCTVPDYVLTSLH